MGGAHNTEEAFKWRMAKVFYWAVSLDFKSVWVSYDCVSPTFCNNSDIMVPYCTDSD